MPSTMPTAATGPDLLAKAGDLDLACIAAPPAGLELENLRRRGIDVVRVKWAVKVKRRGLMALFGFLTSKHSPPATTLTFVDQQIRFQAVTPRGAASAEIQIPMAKLSSVEKIAADAEHRQHLKLDYQDGSLTLGDGLTDPELNWLRDRIVMEASGLAWKPVYNVGKRSTRTTSNPDEETYRRLKTSQARLVSLYLEQAVPKIAELEAALASKQLPVARAASHWLKSSSAAIGAMQLSELCQRLEIDLDGKDLARIASLAPHLLAEFEKVSAALRNDAGAAPDSPQEIATTELAPNPAGPLAGVAVLLVEDSRVNQEIAADCLMRAGCSVTLANDGQDAIEALRNATFDVVLMDCQMGGMDGFAATRTIRETEMRTGRAPTPIIALTANALRDDRNLCISAGMNDYLSKPFAEADLIAAVTTWGPQKPEPTGVEAPSETAAVAASTHEYASFSATSSAVAMNVEIDAAFEVTEEPGSE